METGTTTTSVPSTAARWLVVGTASLLAVIGLLVLALFGDLGRPLGLALAATASWAAVTGWKDPLRGVRRLVLTVIVLELMLVLMIEVMAWTGRSDDPWWRGGTWTVLAVLVVPPAYVLLRLVVVILQDRKRA